MTLSHPFPRIDVPLVDPDTGLINKHWVDFLRSLWERTGAGLGGSVTDVELLSAAGVAGGTQEAIDALNSQVPRAVLFVPPADAQNDDIALMALFNTLMSEY